VSLGEAHGGLGLVPAAFGATIYAQYMESDEDRKSAIFERAMQIAERATAACPDNANAFYMFAVAQGRYSQFISMVEALAKGWHRGSAAPRSAASSCSPTRRRPRHARGLACRDRRQGGRHARRSELRREEGRGGTSTTVPSRSHRSRRCRTSRRPPACCSCTGIPAVTTRCSCWQKASTLEPSDAMQALDIARARKLLADLPAMTF